MSFDPKLIRRYRWPFLAVMLLFALAFGYVSCAENMGPFSEPDFTEIAQAEVTPC